MQTPEASVSCPLDLALTGDILVLEHVRELVGLMNDTHRALKPDGVLYVMVPHGHFINAIADPTRVRFFHPQTFKYFYREMPGVRPFQPLSVATTPSSKARSLFRHATPLFAYDHPSLPHKLDNAQLLQSSELTIQPEDAEIEQAFVQKPFRAIQILSFYVSGKSRPRFRDPTSWLQYGTELSTLHRHTG